MNPTDAIDATDAMDALNAETHFDMEEADDYAG